MTERKQFAYRLRWLLLAGAVACLAAAAAWSGLKEDGVTIAVTPANWGILLSPGADFTHGPLWPCTVFFAGLLLVMHWLFLRPRRGWQLTLAQTGRPMTSAVIAAAFMAMLLTTGLVVTLLEIPDAWKSLLGSFDNEAGGLPPAWYGLWAAMAIVWTLWSVVFFIYWRQGDRYTQYARMIRGLLSGSFLELFTAAAVHAWNPNKNTCYCERGSYTGLVFAIAVILWCFGPGLVLLFLRERQRRLAPHLPDVP